MSFTFGGAATTTAGNTFGTTTPSTGFSFGGGDAAKPFGATNTPDNKPAFNFSSPTTSAPAFPSFSFGAKTATTTAASSLFSTPTTTAPPAFGASKPLYFGGGFMSPPNQTVGSPGFGAAQNAAASPGQNVALGMAQPQSSPAPTFGSPNAQATPVGLGAAGNSSFSFGGAATAATGATAGMGATTGIGAMAGTGATAAGGFSFATPASGFSAAQPVAQATTTAAPQSTQPSFLASTLASPSFGTTPAFGSTPALGQSSAFGAKPGSAFSFGTTAAPSFGTTASTAAPSFGTTASSAAPSFGTTASSAAPTFGTTASSAASAFGTSATPTFGTAAAPAFGTAATTTAPASSAPLSFGSTTPAPAFGTAPPASQPSFSQPQATQASTAPSFGTSQPTMSFGTSAAQPAKTTQQSVLSFGTPATAAPTTAAISFGGAPAASLSLGASAAAAAPARSAAAALPAATLAVAAPVSTSAPSGITALGKTTTSATLPALTTVTTTTAAGPPAMVSSITFAQLEENINKWTLELEEQEKTFINQATQINAWDRLLIANGEKIVELNDAVQAVKNEQQSLEHELDFVLAQQKELEELLTPLEKDLHAQPERLEDPERQRMYSLAEHLDTQLRQMSEDLKEVIEHLNETNRSQDSSDPIVQIGRILNAHMSSMQWVDNSIAQISTKLDQLKATHDTLRRDNERSFQLTYN